MALEDMPVGDYHIRQEITDPMGNVITAEIVVNASLVSKKFYKKYLKLTQIQ